MWQNRFLAILADPANEQLAPDDLQGIFNSDNSMGVLTEGVLKDCAQSYVHYLQNWILEAKDQNHPDSRIYSVVNG
jgi:hypothetical protein